MFTGVLPIGTVVLLKGSSKRIMIMGFCQIAAANPNKIYDYVGCTYPEGFVGPDKTFLFDSAQVEKIYAVGYQDEEQFAFKQKVDIALQDIREQEKNSEE